MTDDFNPELEEEMGDGVEEPTDDDLMMGDDGDGDDYAHDGDDGEEDPFSMGFHEDEPESDF